MKDYGQESVDIVELLCKKLYKPFKELSTREKAMITDAVNDSMIGRYSKFLMWGKEQIEQFFKYCETNDIIYAELTAAERWAVEDVFDQCI